MRAWATACGRGVAMTCGPVSWVFVVVLMGMTLSALTGCWTTHSVQTDPTPYLVSECGQTKRVYALNVVFYQEILGHPINGMSPSILYDTAQPAKFGLYHKFRKLPQWRHVDYVETLADVIGPPYPQARFAIDDGNAPVRWVVAVNPLVVAIGTKEAPMRSIGSFHDGKLEMKGPFSFVSERDLDAVAAELVVLDPWPKRWPQSPYATAYVEELTAYADAHKRVITLKRPMALRELLETRPWEK